MSSGYKKLKVILHAWGLWHIMFYIMYAYACIQLTDVQGYVYVCVLSLAVSFMAYTLWQDSESTFE